MEIENTTQKACATTAIINMAELKSLGTVPMISSMPTVCVRTVTSTHTTENAENKKIRRGLKIWIT